MKTVKNLLVVVLVVLLFIFTIQNIETLSTSLSFRLDLYLLNLAAGSLPIYGILLISLFSGLLIGGMMGWVRRYKLRTQCKGLKNLLERKEHELNSLRNLPVLETQDEEKPIQTASSA